MRADIGVHDRINIEFVRWIWSFRSTARPRILALLGDCSCQVVVLRSHGEVRTFLDTSVRPPTRAAGARR
jgi:hypothetical protein